MNQTDLSPAAQRYFDLMEQPDKSLVIEVFAPDAVVLDNGHTSSGLEEIRAWLTGPASEFTTTSTRLAADHRAEISTAAIEIAGDFPGSPVILHYRFTLNAAGQITGLAITT
ncbi:MAG: nuclear transport factor 2 family protein [Herbiconiux sp.]|uniref:nuclear transport factor 2 family protein n=1 Tax=Herbiconiux sp. TaxID=1871186 RepID=UPI0012015594|nr:nuclear transport factor 2 family protein [Herbiconiux sp.]TAJ47278.1 MAG: nuclear transport factor 2 family protein [Herbiconiux sp.]